MVLAPLLAVCLAGPSWASSKFVQNLHKAQSRKEPAERLEYYTRAIDSWEEAEGRSLLAQVHYGRGVALVDLWRFSEADPDLTKAIDLDPINNKAWLLRGKARLQEGRVNDAVADLVEYAGRSPSDIEGLFLLGEAQLKAGRGDAALKACKLAEQQDPSDLRGWLCEGRALMSRKDWPGAERALDAADDRAAHVSTETLLDRAVCRVAQGRHELALKDYSLAVPLMEKKLLSMPHDSAPPPAVARQRQDTSRAFYGRGRVEEFLVQNEAALADYTSACELGHDAACERAAAMAPQAETRAKKPRPALVDPQPEKPKPSKRPKIKNPEGDPGERIYGG